MWFSVLGVTLLVSVMNSVLLVLLSHYFAKCANIALPKDVLIKMIHTFLWTDEDLHRMFRNHNYLMDHRTALVALLVHKRFQVAN